MTDTNTGNTALPPLGTELLREDLYTEKGDEDEGELLKRREPTMQRKGKKLVAPALDGSKKYTVVFDLDETVVYARDGPLYARAYLKDLFRSLKDAFEVIVCTAGERDYAKCVMEEINEDHIIEHLVYRHKKWFNEEDYTKDLRQLGRDLDYTIMVENTPDCVRANPENGIIVEDFEVVPPTIEEDGSLTPSLSPTPAPPDTVVSEKEPTTTDGTSEDAPTLPGSTSALRAASSDGDEALSVASPKTRRRRAVDRTLILLRELLTALAESGRTVPDFLRSCELLSQQTVTGSDGNAIPIYHLGTRRRRKDAGVARKVVKANRDKAPPRQEGTAASDDLVADPPPRRRRTEPSRGESEAQEEENSAVSTAPQGPVKEN